MNSKGEGHRIRVRRLLIFSISKSFPVSKPTNMSPINSVKASEKVIALNVIYSWVNHTNC